MGVFRLALLLGKTLSEMEMSWREFMLWNAYLKLEPPEEGANQRAAALMAQVTNMSGKSLRDGKTVTADDFLGKRQANVQSMEQQIAFMKTMGEQ